MNAKVVEQTCKHCGEIVEFDFNVDDYSEQISIINGKKNHKRIFVKKCPNCHQVNYFESENKAEWGDRKGVQAKSFVISGFFSCLVMTLLIGAALYFAAKGAITVFDWIFK